MFCIDNRCTDVYFNLAVEEYLLKQTQGDYFVIWQSEPSVVMGKNQSVRAEVNEDYRIEKGIRLARRFREVVQFTMIREILILLL